MLTIRSGSPSLLTSVSDTAVTPFVAGTSPFAPDGASVNPSQLPLESLPAFSHSWSAPPEMPNTMSGKPSPLTSATATEVTSAADTFGIVGPLPEPPAVATPDPNPASVLWSNAKLPLIDGPPLPPNCSAALLRTTLRNGPAATSIVWLPFVGSVTVSLTG